MGVAKANISKKVYTTKDFEFEASHFLPNYEGKCSRLHGHSYKLRVSVCRDIPSDNLGTDTVCCNSQESMVMDFHDMKTVVQESLLDLVDHSNLNDFFRVPTAENMVVDFYETLERAFEVKIPGLKLVEVTLWETSDSFATYKGEKTHN